MNIEVRTRGIESTDAVRNHVERRCRFALSRFAREVTDLVVRVEDVNGPKGGIDKRCVVRLSGPSVGVITVEEHADNVFTAVDRLLDRVARTVARSLARARSFEPGRLHPARRHRAYPFAS